ncbi:expressed unknown protein [Seminavis robusta]|uniref:Uncharacterized protein n=1 Tax=Seminavis robusta TaxID=568900 RepID=A0A9N8H0R0_9STRA|nr:expressed unknown protein [Seminavis robusta]|eukprot:Sro5_g004250.1 n/a (142) ;mRNA; f:107174-107599
MDYFLNLPNEHTDMDMEIMDTPTTRRNNRHNFNDSMCSLQLSDLEEDLDFSRHKGGNVGSVTVETANPGGMWSSHKKRSSTANDGDACAAARSNAAFLQRQYEAAEGRQERSALQLRPIKRSRTNEKIPQKTNGAVARQHR